MRLSLDLGLGSIATMGGGAPAPVPTDLPLITGTATTEQTLTVTPAVWSEEPDSVAYQWYRADAVMDSGDPLAYTDEEPIPGETGTTYVIAIANYQDAILVAEIATFGSKQVTAFSLAVGPIEYTDYYGGDGTFTDASRWNLGTGMAITGGQLVLSSAGALKTALHNPAIANPAGTYEHHYDVVSVSGGSCRARMINPLQTGTNRNAVGSYVDTVVSTDGNSNAGFEGGAPTVAAIENLRLYRVA